MQTHNALAILTRIKRLFVARSSGAGKRGHYVPLASCLRRAWVVASPVLSGQVREADTDPYLRLVAKEVIKVEESPGEAVTVQEDATRLVAQRVCPAPSRRRFEKLLRKRRVGTYSFCSRLTERCREAILVDYGTGVSMEALREKVVDKGASVISAIRAAGASGLGKKMGGLFRGAWVFTLMVALGMDLSSEAVAQATQAIPFVAGKPYLHVIHERRSVKVQRVQDAGYTWQEFGAVSRADIGTTEKLPIDWVWSDNCCRTEDREFCAAGDLALWRNRPACRQSPRDWRDAGPGMSGRKDQVLPWRDADAAAMGFDQRGVAPASAAVLRHTGGKA